MPSLRLFSPTWWALGPFAQTVVHGSRVVNDATPYQREYAVMRDGVAVALDWKFVDPSLPPEAPLIVLCHGLGGNSMTNSCNGVSEVLARRGWRVVVYNRRGHGGSSLLAVDPPDSISRTASEGEVEPAASGDSDGGRGSGSVQQSPRTVTVAFPPHVDLDDLSRVVAHVHCRYPAARKALVGLSAGSNLVVRFQGDCAAESPFAAAVSVSNGHELTHLTKALLRKPLTDLLLVKFLKEVLYDRYEEVQHLAAAAGVSLDWGRLLAATHTRDFEAHLTAPLCGFAHVDEYYGANECYRSFQHVRAPLLCLSNSDDPVIEPALIRHAQEAARTNPAVISVATVRGGHLGWLAGTAARPWMHHVLAEFLDQVFSSEAAVDASGTCRVAA